MPSTLISIRRPRPAQERAAIVAAVHDALVAGIRIPPHDRTVRLQTFAPEDFAVGPAMGPDYTLIEITLFPGRTLAAKRALYKELVGRLGELGIPAGDVKVILHEVPRENWGLRGGIPGSEIDLNFKIEV
jgi:phenylpyruvate tautomerase PptA (4-oxalocrotonate tautomerase family)